MAGLKMRSLTYFMVVTIPNTRNESFIVRAVVLNQYSQPKYTMAQAISLHEQAILAAQPILPPHAREDSPIHSHNEDSENDIEPGMSSASSDNEDATIVDEDQSGDQSPPPMPRRMSSFMKRLLPRKPSTQKIPPQVVTGTKYDPKDPYRLSQAGMLQYAEVPRPSNSAQRDDRPIMVQMESVVHTQMSFSRCIFMEHVVATPRGITQGTLRCDIHEGQGEVTLNLSSKGKIPLGHSRSCPAERTCAHGLTLPAEYRRRPVSLAVCCIVESADGAILLTRRAKNMRAFPHAWVPPGGHVDKGETLVDAMEREVLEETGIDLAQDRSIKPTMLGVWESLYPVKLCEGLPSKHHLVVYYHVKLSQKRKKIALKLSPNETDAAAWLDAGCIQDVIQNKRTSKRSCNGYLVDPPPSALQVKAKFYTGNLLGGVSRYNSLANTQHVTEGTRFAIRLWLESNNA